MDEALIFEKIGRLQVELESMNVEYGKLLAALDRVRSGEVLPAQLAVDLQSQTWVILPATETPSA